MNPREAVLSDCATTTGGRVADVGLGSAVFARPGVHRSYTMTWMNCMQVA